MTAIYVVVLGMTFSHILHIWTFFPFIFGLFYSFSIYNFVSFFFLDFSIPFLLDLFFHSFTFHILFGLLNRFSNWTFISLSNFLKIFFLFFFFYFYQIWFLLIFLFYYGHKLLPSIFSALLSKTKVANEKTPSQRKYNFVCILNKMFGPSCKGFWLILWATNVIQIVSR